MVELLSYADGSHGVKAYTAEQQEKQQGMSMNERQVYQHIKTSGNKGTWLKDVKSKSGLHQQIVTQCIKSLERLGHIKSVKSVKAPTKKLYMVPST
jgi:DNA-directed RNA polymerase III subunit RPC6